MKRRIISIIIVIFSLTGLLASFALTIEEISFLKEPHQLVCDINSVINCSTVMQSPQANLLGFPNSLMGIAGYAMTLILGLLIDKLDRKILFGLLIGSFGAFVFSQWLIYQSVFNIGAICPFCVLSGISSANIFFASLIKSLKSNLFNLNKNIDEKIQIFINKQYYFFIFGLWYFLLIGLIFNEIKSIWFE